MAHQINFNEKTGQHSFFSVQQKAWHGLGQIVDSYPTSAEALQFAGLDYTVEKRPVFTYDTENSKTGGTDGIRIPEIEVPGFYATIRTDTEKVLGVVGKDYRIVQNVDAFTFFDSIVGGEGIMYETAGALGAGERIFITAKLPEYIKVGKEDLIEKYIVLTTSHDGSGSITAAFTPVRIVCSNTLSMALNNCSNVVKIRHTTNAQERLKQAHKIMGISNMLTTQLEGIFNEWAKVRITDRQVLRLIQEAMSPSREVLDNVRKGATDDLSSCFTNICNNALTYAMVSPTQQTDTTKGTLFGAYNAVTGYFQNVKEFKTGEDKLNSILFGTGLLRSQTAFKLCEQFQKHGEAAFMN
jgi:phage/plasmid-like protein (TIGR03299 family)